MWKKHKTRKKQTQYLHFETAPKTNPYTFDLHPEIPLDKRINYNFAEKEIETVGKKSVFAEMLMRSMY